MLKVITFSFKIGHVNKKIKWEEISNLYIPDQTGGAKK